MKNILMTALILTVISLCSVSSRAQVADEPDLWAGIFGAAGAATDFEGGTGVFHLGGEMQGLLSRHFGVEADIGYFASFENPGDGLGLFNPGVFVLLGDGSRTRPFLDAGYSMFFRSAIGSGVYFGGGVNHWFSDRLGIQFAGRDQVFLESGTFHLLEVRVGLIFQ